MATASTFTEATNPTDGSAARLLVSLTPLSADALEPTLRNIAAAFSGREVQVATPDPLPPDIEASLGLRAFTYTPAAPSAGGWLLTAADFLNTYKEMEQHGATACLLLGPEAQTLSSEGLAALASGVLSEGVDLTVPHYDLGPRDGLVNAAILYPTTRAIFGTKPRYPLAVDLALSARMAERLATASQRLTAAGLNNGLLWPVSEAASAGYTIAEAHVGRRGLPAPDSIDLNALLAQVTGSLFADIEAKASFWQRARVAYSPKAAAARTQTPALADRAGAWREPGYTANAGIFPPRVYQSARDLVAGAAAKLASWLEEALVAADCGVPHGGRVAGRVSSTTSPGVPVAHHQPWPSAGRTDAALPCVGSIAPTDDRGREIEPGDAYRESRGEIRNG